MCSIHIAFEKEFKEFFFFFKILLIFFYYKLSEISNACTY